MGRRGGGACDLTPPTNFQFFHVYISSEIIKLDGVPNIISLEIRTCSLVHNKQNLMLLIIMVKFFEYYIIQALESKYLKNIIDA